MFRRVVMLLCVGGSVAVAAASAHADLIAHWPMNGGAGQTVVDVVGGFHGTIQGNVVWSPDAKIGAFALEYDGAAGSVVDMGEVNLDIGQNWTLAHWHKASPMGWIGYLINRGTKAAKGHYHTAFRVTVPSIYIPDIGADLVSTVNVADNAWHHTAWTYNGTEIVLYVDGEPVQTWARSGSFDVGVPQPFTIGSNTPGETQQAEFKGALDDVAIFSKALTREEIQQIMLGIPVTDQLARDPSPEDGATDVPADAVLHWTPGEFAVSHDVYFGTALETVGSASRSAPLGVLAGQGQAATAYDPGMLEFGGTYYWRIDEVNGPPDNTVFKGDVWTFTVEPPVYPLESTRIMATASSSSSADEGPQNTVNRSGLDANDLHGVDVNTMWLTRDGDAGPAWIRYDFDKVYKLHELLIWNHNSGLEAGVGFGIKEALIETSVDGSEWIPLGTTHVLAQAPGKAGYAANTTVDMKGVAAKCVRLTALSNWRGALPQYGLSEVRFLYVPMSARQPQPAMDAVQQETQLTLSWRAGRQAVMHEVYLSADRQAVADGTALLAKIAQTECDTGPLELGRTYYWKVNEINEAQNPAAWEGDVWQFQVKDHLVVDDFESYTNDSPNRIFQRWIDGLGFTDPAPGNLGNHSGAGVGHDIWSEGTPYTKIVETTVVRGKQSMPFYYDNTGSVWYSQADRTWPDGQDWTVYGAGALRLWRRGQQKPGSIRFDATGGVYTMTSAGPDIFGTADAFHFAFKQLTGNGSITARVDSIANGAEWAKIGVMVRATLAPGSPHALMCVTPTNRAYMCWRPTANAATPASRRTNPDALTLPHWVRITRTGNVLVCEHSADNMTWSGPTGASTTGEIGIILPETVYIGLEMTSYKAGQFATATFSNVTTTGNVTPSGPFTQSQDIGIVSIDSEPLYVAVEDTSGRSAVVAHPDGETAVNVTQWTAWDISYDKFAGVNMAAVKKMTIRIGDRNATTPGGAGLIYIDDIQLRPPGSGEAK